MTAPALVKAGLAHPRSAPAVVADATRLPFPDESADLVTAFMCLHDFDDMPAAVAEAAHILTPGGRFAVALHHPFVTARSAKVFLHLLAVASQQERSRPGDSRVLMAG